MRQGFKITIALAALFAAAQLVGQTSRTADVQFKAAQHKEEVEGDLKGAIEQYKKLAQSSDRAIAAKALIQMAGCYQKLGDAEARKIYEQVVKNYADQKEAVTLARARLGMGDATQNAGIVTRQVWTGPNTNSASSVSPDGRFLSYTDWTTGDLALHDLITGQDRRVTNKGGWDQGLEYAYEAKFSPDGKQLAYEWTLSAAQASVDRHFFELRLIDLNSARPRVLFSNPEVNWITLHDWSPDGTWLAVELERMDRTKQVGLISTASGALRVLKSLDWSGVSKMAFSPDSKYLAYGLTASADSEHRDIFVMDINGKGETPIAPHPANDRVLGWSPVGERLLFVSDRGGSNGVWAVPVPDGKPQGAPQLIKADIGAVSIGLTRSGTLYYGVVASTRDVSVASADFETGKVLSPPTMIAAPYVGFNDWPQWSPDGKYLAYLSSDPNLNSGPTDAVAILSAVTAKVRVLMNPNHLHINNTRLLWFPDGNFLVVNGTDNKGRQGLYRIDAQNGETALLLDINQTQGATMMPVAWSPDGRTLYIREEGRKPNEFMVIARDMQSGNEREIVQGDLGVGPNLSPDGRFLAVMRRDASKQSTSLLIVPLEGGEPRELLRASAPEILVGALSAWTPDGKSILFLKDKGDKTPRELWRIAAEGGAPRKVVLNVDWVDRLGVSGIGPATFHPDGHHVAFAMGDPRVEIWALENFLPKLAARK